MATSSSTDYNLTARQVITFALRKINIIAQHETPSAEDASTAMTELNLMLKGWQRYEHIWRKTEGSISITHDTQSYALSTRPYRVLDVRYRDSNSIDTMMNELTRDEYYNLPQKSSTGVTTSWYYDHQRDTDTVYTWPVFATDGGNALTYRYTYQRLIEDVDTLDENIDIPVEYLELVGYQLASQLIDSYGRTGDHINRIIARAEALKTEMLDDDRGDFIQFVPDMMNYG